MKRSPLGRKPSGKRQPLPPEAARWRDDPGPCVLANEPGHVCDGPLDPHHVLTRQVLRKRGADEWDKRNRLWVDRRAHENHHSRSQPIPRRVLPDSAWEFAAEVDLTRLLMRDYPEAAA